MESLCFRLGRKGKDGEESLCFMLEMKGKDGEELEEVKCIELQFFNLTPGLHFYTIYII